MFSEFESQIDGTNVICPYCEAKYQPESEDYSEDSREEQCDTCGNKYHLHQSFEVEHHTRPDCALNGKEHQYERVKLSNGREADFCTVCDDCQCVRDES